MSRNSGPLPSGKLGGREQFARATGVSRETLARFDLYAEILTRWQSRINLVSAATLQTVWERHFLDSAQLLDHCPADARSLVDMGSGAGFPGMVLALLGVPNVTLIDSDVRKGVFLREVARMTETDVTVITARLEAAPPSRADIVTARALAPVHKLLELGSRFAHEQTVFLFPKGQDVEADLTTTTIPRHIYIERHPSLTDSAATILRLKETSRDSVPHDSRGPGDT